MHLGSAPISTLKQWLLLNSNSFSTAPLRAKYRPPEGHFSLYFALRDGVEKLLEIKRSRCLSVEIGADTRFMQKKGKVIVPFGQNRFHSEAKIKKSMSCLNIDETSTLRHLSIAV